MDEPQKPQKLNLRTVAFADQEARVVRAKAEAEARADAEKKRATFMHKVKVAEVLTGQLPRDGMAPVFFAAARRIATDILLGNIPIRNGTDAGAAVNALMAAGRAEEGGASSEPDITKPPADRKQAEARMREIRTLARKRAEAEAEQAAGE